MTHSASVRAHLPGLATRTMAISERPSEYGQCPVKCGGDWRRRRRSIEKERSMHRVPAEEGSGERCGTYQDENNGHSCAVVNCKMNREIFVKRSDMFEVDKRFEFESFVSLNRTDSAAYFAYMAGETEEERVESLYSSPNVGQWFMSGWTATRPQTLPWIGKQGKSVKRRQQHARGSLPLPFSEPMSL